MREAPYAEVVGAGPYLFTLGDVAFELGAGVHPDVRQPDWTWFGSEIAAEAEHNLALLSERLEAAGSDLAHVVHATVMVADTADLRELDDVWERAFPQAPPARTVVPVTGLASPRRAGARGHGENAVRYMTMCRAVRRDAGPATVVPDGSGVLGAASGAVSAAGLLWVSGQCAADPDGLPAGSGATAQAAVAFERVRALCEAGGTSLGELLVLRAFAADREAIDAVHALVREAFPADPPVVIALPVAGPPAIDGVRVTLDAIAHVPTAAPTEVQP
nr:RidA family protein [Conexibacter arvalis]